MINPLYRYAHYLNEKPYCNDLNILERWLLDVLRNIFKHRFENEVLCSKISFLKHENAFYSRKIDSLLDVVTSLAPDEAPATHTLSPEELAEVYDRTAAYYADDSPYELPLTETTSLELSDEEFLGKASHA